MIDALKDDKISNVVGGRFKLTALMQKRWLQLMSGARPMIDAGDKTELEVIAQEILEGKIVGEFAPPAPAAGPEETPSVSESE